MTVPAQTPITEHAANGVSVTFAYNFKILQEDHLAVYEDGAVVLSGFTVSGVGNDAGGSITYSVAPASGTVITLEREVPYERQDYDYSLGGDFNADVVDADLDTLIMLVQQIQAQLETQRLIRKSAGASSSDPFDVGSVRLESVADPVGAQDAATKNFVSVEVINQIANAGTLPYTPPSLKNADFNAEINTAYALNQNSIMEVTLPESPANGSWVVLHCLYPDEGIDIVAQGANIIMPNGQEMGITNLATANTSGSLEDNTRDGSSEYNREWVVDAYNTDFKVKNYTAGGVVDITDNDETTLTCPGLDFTIGDVYKIGYSKFSFVAAGASTRRAAPAFIHLIYNSVDSMWNLGVIGDAGGLPYNANRLKHVDYGLAGSSSMDTVDNVESAIQFVYQNTFRLFGGRLGSATVLTEFDVSSTLTDNTQAPVFVHTAPTAHRTLTIDDSADGIPYHIVNAATGAFNMVLSAGSGVNYLTLIKSGSVTRTSGDVTVPPGSSCKFRKISAEECIIYDCDTLVTK